MCRSRAFAFLRRGGSLWVQISDGRAHRPSTIVRVRKLNWLPFVWSQNMCSALFGFVTKHACLRQVDRQTDSITSYDSQDRASIPESRGKNYSRALSTHSLTHSPPSACVLCERTTNPSLLFQLSVLTEITPVSPATGFDLNVLTKLSSTSAARQPEHARH